MDWSDLRYALVVAREGGVTAAAKELGVAHTTLYRRINSLEERHGVRFFDRTGATWDLTDAGRELLDVGAELEERVDAFERRLRGKDQRLEGTVTLATVEPLAVELTGHLHRFAALHPGIQIVLQVTADLVAVGADADVALRVSQSPPPNLKGRRIGTVAFAAYAASTVVGRGGVDLTTSRWVCFDSTLAKTPQARWEAENVREDQVALRTNNRSVFLEAVSLGAGVGVLPCAMAASVAHLVRVTDVLPELGLPLWLLTHEDLAPMPRVRAVLDFVADALAGMRDRLEGGDRR